MNDWISVRDRPPDDLQSVNIAWINRNPAPYYKDIKDQVFVATGIYYKHQWYWYSCVCEDYLTEYGKCDFDMIDSDIEVLFWQPLPDPPTVNIMEV